MESLGGFTIEGCLARQQPCLPKCNTNGKSSFLTSSQGKRTRLAVAVCAKLEHSPGVASESSFCELALIVGEARSC